jgi:hypothetical protein
VCRAFFQRWWAEQTPQVQATVKQLVAAGQFEFINGASLATPASRTTRGIRAQCALRAPRGRHVTQQCVTVTLESPVPLAIVPARTA